MSYRYAPTGRWSFERDAAEQATSEQRMNAARRTVAALTQDEREAFIVEVWRSLSGASRKRIRRLIRVTP